MTSREQVAQRPPRAPLTGFPTVVLGATTEVYRAHLRALGPWWFSSSGDGRFDLAAPRGTCYLADSPLAALRERLGVVLGESPTVPASLLEDADVSTLRLPTDTSLADLQAPRATDYGVTRELETMVPYVVPQAWAAAFAAGEHGGMRYGPRFSTGPASSYAVFGPAGPADLPADPRPVPARDVPGAPTGLQPPRRWDVTVVRPPRTRTR